MNNVFSFGVILLAGGSAKRFGTSDATVPKLLEDINGTPVLGHILNMINRMNKVRINGITAIISKKYEDPLRSFFSGYPAVNIAIQQRQRGTADAIWQSIEQKVFPSTTQYVLVLMGDQPLMNPDVLTAFCGSIVGQRKNAGILMFKESREKPLYKKCSVVQYNNSGSFVSLAYGTPIPHDQVEDLHAGPYIFKTSFLEGLLNVLAPHYQHQSDTDPEFHLYEPLKMAQVDGGVLVHECRTPEFCLGVDTPEILEYVKTYMSTNLKAL